MERLTSPGRVLHGQHLVFCGLHGNGPGPPIAQIWAFSGQADRQVIGFTAGCRAVWPGCPGSIHWPVSGSHGEEEVGARGGGTRRGWWDQRPRDQTPHHHSPGARSPEDPGKARRLGLGRPPRPQRDHPSPLGLAGPCTPSQQPPATSSGLVNAECAPAPCPHGICRQ